MATNIHIQDLHPDIMTCALRRLDGPSLAAVGCASSHLRAISSDPSIWRDLCLSTWPSLRHPSLSLHSCNDYRSLFASAFPFPCQSSVPQSSQSSQSTREMSPLPRKLISAVDLQYRGELIYSEVVEIDTSSAWFLGAPFRIDVLNEKSSCDRSIPLPESNINISELNLSWILINPESKRAVNVSSRRPVSVDRHWYTGETLVKYGMVINDTLTSIVVTCGEDNCHLKEVSMTIEDEDGVGVSGKESLEMITGAMRGRKRWRGDGNDQETEAKRRYEEFVMRRRSRKERKARKECLFDLCCTGVSAVVFMALIAFVVFR